MSSDQATDTTPATTAGAIVTDQAVHSIPLDHITAVPRRHPAITVLSILSATLGTILLIAALLFHLQGGHWFIVKTPSMGTTAPVGTLILTTPTTAAALHVGDVIAFHPPTTPGETYTHRIIKIGATGLISTKGDINGAADPWQLSTANLVGKATIILPGLGWLIRGLPITLLGVVIVFLGTARMQNTTHQASYRIAGISLAVSLAAFFLKPFTGVVVETTGVQHGAPTATVVSTGLFPIRVTATHGTHTDLTSGQLGQVHVPTSAHHGFYALTTTLHLSVWGWVAVIGVCSLPLLWTLIVGLPPREQAAA